MLTVQTCDFDPRSGEVRCSVENLQCGESDPALFMEPADHEIRPRLAPGAPARG